MICPSCGLLTDVEICSHHTTLYGDDWATSNRIMCDFFHRGIVPARVEAQYRDDEIPDNTFYALG